MFIGAFLLVPTRPGFTEARKFHLSLLQQLHAAGVKSVYRAHQSPGNMDRRILARGSELGSGLVFAVCGGRGKLQVAMFGFLVKHFVMSRWA